MKNVDINKEELFTEMRKISREELSRAVNEIGVPQNYTKCAVCGMIIPVDRVGKCPYCKPDIVPDDEPKPEPEKPEDEVGTILHIIDEDDGNE